MTIGVFHLVPRGKREGGGIALLLSVGSQLDRIGPVHSTEGDLHHR